MLELYNPNKYGITVFPRYAFSNPEISETDDLPILNKLVLNYVEPSKINDLTTEQKQSFSNYAKFLYNSYFGIEEAVETDDMNNVVFDYYQWNLMVKLVKQFQDYGKNRMLNEYNSFINVFADSIGYSAQVMNEYFRNSLNKVYENNQFEDGTPIMQPAHTEHFEEKYQTLINNYLADIQKNVHRVYFGTEQPNLPLTIWVDIKEVL